MSKKTLLQENTIRRFMKLASIDPLAEAFVDKIKEEDEELEESKEELEEEDKELEEGFGELAGDRDDEVGVEPEMDVPPPMEPEPGDEVPMDLPGEEDAGLGLSPEAAEEVAEKLATGFAEVVQDALGVEGLLSVETGDEAPMDDVPPPMEEPGEELPPSMPPEEEEEMMQENDEDFLDEVTKKIVERLLAQKKNKKVKEKYVDNLAEQITDRIFSSSKKR